MSQRIAIICGLISVFIILSMIQLTTIPIQAISSAWTLTVKVTDPPFGIKYVYVNVKGPYGWSDGGNEKWSNLQNGGDPNRVYVVFNVPANAIPKGTQFEVCASSDVVGAILSANCHRFIHSHDGNGQVQISLR